MITLFNLINNMYDLNSSDFITPSITNHNTRGHNFKLYKPDNNNKMNALHGTHSSIFTRQNFANPDSSKFTP